MRCCIKNSFSILLSLLLIVMSIFDSKVVSLSTKSCQTECGNIKIPYPFGIEKGCYLNEWYKIVCKNATSPFLFRMGMEVVNISLPEKEYGDYNSGSFGYIRVKSPITSVGCSTDGKGYGSALNLTGSPFFFGFENSLVAVGCNSKASLTNIGPTKVGCELNCTTIKEKSPNKNIPYFDKTGCNSDALPYTYIPVCTKNKREEERSCDGNGCCSSSLPSYEAHQVIGVKIESFDHGNMTSRKCRVAFLTDEVYTLSNATGPERFFAKGFAIVRLGWVIQTKNLKFLNSLSCINTKEYDNLTYSMQLIKSCRCSNITINETNYANCGCSSGYTGNPYIFGGCKDINDCLIRNPDGSRWHCRESDTCVNLPGTFNCVGDKTGAIMIGVGAGLGIIVLVGGIWWLRKFLEKRRMNKRKKKFFERNGGLLLQQQLHTREGNVEKTRIFSSTELEKATENFSENRILGQGGQGTVYKGMLVDGKTVAVKKSTVVDEDKLEEFINEVVILSQINHRHVVKLLGCCLETEVPVLVYEFVVNGNLFQHIHEESDDYTVSWAVRLRISVDIAGALSYLHSAASSPIYHRDIKSTNILLDEKYRAKVSDFGTSRSVTVDHTHWTTIISGTVGYVDPEYYGSSQYTDKSDVYSFGVILVELLTGEKPVIALENSREIRGLAEHFRVAMKENRFFDIMDARITDGCKTEQVMAVANLAMRCLNSKGKKRPNMRQVFTELEKIYSSPEDSLVQLENDNDVDEAEEGINTADMWTIGVTAPASSIVTSSLSLEVEPLLSRPTW
ncbi:hypothetical protein CARUB_v10011311mg [Capsella rubella]|uniref:Protein kinase domain-containing protein n=1 Tax=Capsella rubella TaxID=81985 RepID=R0GNA1_9BRAS|nr:putative wall-associated receptor kinase-like 11 [Capsella rubella]EOA37407.1 hypothetical protein CARUB_v10011311mg [Capsella rubella]